MSRINIHNYEAYYLDYLEGNLNVGDTLLFEQFLAANPELETTFESFEELKLDTTEELTFDKDELLQNIDETNAEEYIIADLENEIATDDAVELEAYLKGNSKAKVLAKRYHKTILQKVNVTFVEKEKLKREMPIIYLWASAVSIAATILIFFLFNTSPSEKPTNLIGSYQNPVDSTRTKVESKLLASEEEFELAAPKIKMAPKLEFEVKPLLPIKKALLTEQSPKEVEVLQQRADAVAFEDKPLQKEEELVLEAKKEVAPPVENKPEPQEIEEIVVDNLTTIVIEKPQGATSVRQELTLPEWANKSMGRPILNTEKGTLNGGEILAVVADKVSDLTNDNVAFSQTQTGTRTKLSISIGKFGFSRSKRR